MTKNEIINRLSQIAALWGLAIVVGTPVRSVFAQTSQPSEVAFAQQQLDLVNAERVSRLSAVYPNACADQFLKAASNYYEWIAKYEPTVREQYKLFDDAAYKIDSFILSNTFISGFTYQKQANGPAVQLTYADFREYLKWTHRYALSAPDLGVLTTNLNDPLNNKWGLTYDKAKIDVIDLLETQLNQCGGEQCVHIYLSAELVDKKGMMIRLDIPAGQLKRSLQNLLVDDKSNYVDDYLRFDVTKYIENQIPFENVMANALGDLNPAFVKLAYGEPNRWNYFADTFIAKSCGVYSISPDKSSVAVYSYNDLKGSSSPFGLPLAAGTFAGSKSSHDIVTIRHDGTTWQVQIAKCSNDWATCSLNEKRELVCPALDWQWNVISGRGYYCAPSRWVAINDTTIQRKFDYGNTTLEFAPGDDGVMTRLETEEQATK